MLGWCNCLAYLVWVMETRTQIGSHDIVFIAMMAVDMVFMTLPCFGNAVDFPLLELWTSFVGCVDCLDQFADLKSQCIVGMDPSILLFGVRPKFFLVRFELILELILGIGGIKFSGGCDDRAHFIV